MKVQLPPKLASRSDIRSPKVRLPANSASTFSASVFVVGEALDDVLLEPGKLAALARQHLRHVARAEAIEIPPADEPVGRKIGVFLADAINDRWAHHIKTHGLARGYVFAADRTGVAGAHTPLRSASFGGGR